MIFQTEGFVLDLKRRENVLYLNLYSPLGRIYCYASRVNRNPVFRNAERIKYSEVRAKVFFRGAFLSGMTVFPGEVIEIEVISPAFEDEMRRRVFRYARYLFRSFSVVKSGEGFYGILKGLYRVLSEDVMRCDVSGYIFSVELLLFRMEGLLREPFMCKHIDFRRPLAFLIDREMFLCMNCASAYLEREASYMRYVDGYEAEVLHELFSAGMRNDPEEAVRRVCDILRDLREDVLKSGIQDVWNSFFTYHYLSYSYLRRGVKFLELRERFLREGGGRC